MLVSTASSTPANFSNPISKVEKDKNGFIITRKKAAIKERDPDPELTRAIAESIAMENGFRGEVQPREVEEKKEKGMLFTLLTKKGNKQQVSTIVL